VGGIRARIAGAASDSADLAAIAAPGSTPQRELTASVTGRSGRRHLDVAARPLGLLVVEAVEVARKRPLRAGASGRVASALA